MVRPRPDTSHAFSVSTGSTTSVRRKTSAYALRLLFLLSLASTAAPVAAALPMGSDLATRDKSVRGQFDRAVGSFVDAEFVAAERAFREIESSDRLDRRDRPFVHYLIGRCLYGQGEYGFAITVLHEAIDSDEEGVVRCAASLYLGHTHFRLNDRLAAARAYVSALQNDDSECTRVAEANLEPLLRSGLTPFELDRLIGDLDDDPDLLRVRFTVAQRWESLGRRLDAIEEYALVGASMPDGPIADSARVMTERLRQSLEEEIVIGLLVPASGEYANYGGSVADGARMAAAQSRASVRLMIKDTRGDPVTAVWAADSLVNAGCDAVVGPLLPGTIAATVPILRAHEIPQILPILRRATGDVSALSAGVVVLSVPPDIQVRRLVSHALGREQLRQFAGLFPDTPEGRQIGSAYAEAILSSGGTVYPLQYLPPNATDYTPWLRRIKSVVRDDRDELLPPADSDEEEEITVYDRWRVRIDGFLIWGDPETIGRAVAQVRAFGIEGRLLGNGSWADSSLRESLTGELDSALFVSDEWIDPTGSVWREWSSDFRLRYGRVPDWLAARSYDAVTWLLRHTGSRRAGSFGGSIAAIVSDTLSGVSGTYHWSASRESDAAVIYRFRFGRPAPVRE